MLLNSRLDKEFRLNEYQRKALNKLGLFTIFDLLHHFPTRYGDTSEIKMIENLNKGDEAVIFGKISNLKTSKAFVKKIPMSEGTISDETGSIKSVWFNQPYIAKMIPLGSMVRVQGKVAERKAKPRSELSSTTGGELYFSNPKIEAVSKVPIGVGKSLFGESGDGHSLYPVYPESKGVTSNWFYHAIQKIILSKEVFEKLDDLIPEEILKKYNLPSLKTALIWIHAPKEEKDAEMARKRFAFQEIFLIQLEKQRERKIWQKEKSFIIETSKNHIEDFISHFPFRPTDSQMNAINKITADFKRGFPMSRLLEGDVGSGKTAVAASTVYAVTKTSFVGKDYGNLQTAYMVPTEILAKQHFESFISFFRHLPIKIGLVTSSECRIFPSKTNKDGWTHISKSQLLKWVKNGEVPVLIGTHSLIQKSVEWKHLAYVVIDEQHRFGTAQRQKLTQKNSIKPHLLSMTATPIPRTLALTMYGDLDLTLLEGMPHGRKPIITKIIWEQERNRTYEEIKKELVAGRQLYVICPRIDEPDPTKEMAILAKSVKLEAERLKKNVFQDWNIAILHSKMTPKEKDKVMDDFLAHKTDILVATSVVEVGVNVPNATMIIIEGAERFGLSQLHQLRGRVIRSNHQAYCYIFSESKSQKTKDRLKAMITAKNGFELAEFDLSQRGAGELSGSKQWGVSDLAMTALQNMKMVEAAREEATKIIDKDSELKKYPLLAERIQNKKTIHFE